MVLDRSRLKDALLLAFVVGLLLTGGQPGAVNALPGFSDHTGPSELSLASFERLDSGCRDDVADYADGSVSGGNFSRVSFVRTGDPDADLSAWVERTSPPGTDLSTFRVHIESHASVNSSNVSPRGDSTDSTDSATSTDSTDEGPCEMGVQYRIEVTTSGGSPEGVLPDAHGIRILWLENGEYAGCSASYTSPLRGDCLQFYRDETPDRTWANATTN